MSSVEGTTLNFFNTKNASYLKSIIKTYLFVRPHLYHNLSMSQNLNNNSHLCFFRKIYFISSISPPQPALHQRSLQPWNPSTQMSLTEPGIIRTATPFPRSIPRKRRQENWANSWAAENIKSPTSKLVTSDTQKTRLYFFRVVAVKSWTIL